MPNEKEPKVTEVEALIDETVDESFPASDPPNWAAIAEHERKQRVAQEEQRRREGGLGPPTGAGRAEQEKEDQSSGSSEAA